MARKASYLASGVILALSFSTGMPIMIANGLIFLIVTWFADRWMIYHVTKTMRASGKATRRMIDTMTMAVPLHLVVGFFMISYR
jgi:hypothetical protein